MTAPPKIKPAMAPLDCPVSIAIVTKKMQKNNILWYMVCNLLSILLKSSLSDVIASIKGIKKDKIVANVLGWAVKLSIRAPAGKVKNW